MISIHKGFIGTAYTACGKPLAGVVFTGNDESVNCPFCLMYFIEGEWSFLPDSLVDKKKEDSLLVRTLFIIFCGVITICVLLFLLSFEV